VIQISHSITCFYAITSNKYNLIKTLSYNLGPHVGPQTCLSTTYNPKFIHRKNMYTQSIDKIHSKIHKSRVWRTFNSSAYIPTQQYSSLKWYCPKTCASWHYLTLKRMKQRKGSWSIVVVEKFYKLCEGVGTRSSKS